MDRGLLLVGLFVGVLLCLSVFLLPPRVRYASPPKRLWLPLGLGIFAALLTLPSRGYFGLGGQLGAGCALGALAAALGAWSSELASDSWKARLSSAGAGIAAVALILLFLRGSLFDALGGLALGWLGVSFLLAAGSVASLIFGTLVAGIGIAGYRAAPGGASAALLLLAGGGLLFSLLPRLWSGWRGILAFLLLFGLESRWLTVKVLPDAGKLIYAPFIGAALGLMLIYLRQEKRQSPALGLLLVLAGHVIGSHLGGAYGAALLSVALLVVAGFVGEGADPGPLALAALLVVYRWLPLRWPELRMGFTDHHALPGLMLGALLALLASPRIAGLRGNLSAIGLAAAIIIGALTLFGPKAVLPMGIGLALGVLIAFPLPRFATLSPSSPVEESNPEILLALGALFALIQFAGHLLPVVEMGRTVRVEILVGLGVTGIALWAISSPRHPGGTS